MPELTAEELKAKEAEEASSQAKEKATQATLKKEQEDQAIKDKELSDAQKLKIYEIQSKTVREQGARLSATEKELADLRAAKKEAEKPTVEESAKSFYADPAKAIEEALARAIEPLNVFKDGIESETSYDRIKKKLMSNPVYAQHLGNAQFSAIVDELIAEGQRTTGKVTEAMVEATIKHTIGGVVTGDIVLAPVKESDTDKTKTDAEREEESKVIPPYLQPSSPPQKKVEDKKQYRDLTENEARLARERGQTKEQYLDWLEVDPSDVIDSKIGMPEKKGEGK